MKHFVYMIRTVNSKINKSYVGYSNNPEKRLIDHNKNKGAKSTKGHNWKLIYKKKFETKSEAMRFEYCLKKDRKMRKFIINKS
tara:strand:+ start:1490 stop:1738 length:249 start_codon:yes stop_codon:yes gene_type:complete